MSAQAEQSEKQQQLLFSMCNHTGGIWVHSTELLVSHILKASKSLYTVIGIIIHIDI